MEALVHLVFVLAGVALVAVLLAVSVAPVLERVAEALA